MSVGVESVEDRDCLAGVREHRAAVEQFAEGRTDQLGGMARVLCALADDEQPTEGDLMLAGLPPSEELEGGE